MRDFNFFSEYVFTESKLKPRTLVLPVFILIIVCSIIGTYLYLEYEIDNKESTIAEQEQYLSDDEVVRTKKELDALREEYNYLSVLEGETTIFQLLIQTSYSVTEELTDTILNAVPRNIAFSTYIIDDNQVFISGIATERTDVAEFENNLRNTNIFMDIYVSVIRYNEETEHYDFIIEVVQGGESNDQ